MALIHWKQIDGDLTSARVLTGSLKISGSIDINALNGVNNFTGSFKNISGSFDINLDGNTDKFGININNVEQVGVNKDGVFKLAEKSVTPTAVSGGLFYSSSDDYFLGFKN